MNLYRVTLSIHLIVAIVGVGLIAAIPIAARVARLSDGKTDLLEVLFRRSRWSFGVMLLTGILLDYTVGGAFHAARWFQASVLLLVFLGFSHARGRASLRSLALRSVEGWGWTMSATVALMAVLMELKPFP